MLTEEECVEVTDEMALLMRRALARQPSDIAIAFVEVLGIVFMADLEGTFPKAGMAWIRKSLQRFPGLERYIEVLAQEAMHRADRKRQSGGVSESI
jgi:hypothetical protein